MMSAPPVIYQGDAVYGKVYQTMAKDSTRPSYLRLVVGVAKGLQDAVLSFLKEKVEPIYEESESPVTGAVFDRWRY